jgi:maleamate amidohydrolase
VGKPWDGVIPAADQAAYRTDSEQLSKPMQVGEKPALIIVDMTRAFVDSAYITGYSETGYPAVRANRRLLKAARGAGIPIFYTKQRAASSLPVTTAEQGLWKRRLTPRRHHRPSKRLET